MQDTLKIHNWDKWQSYRSDRGQPPWIKIHREVMRHVEWVSLSDSQRGQLVAIWLLAADRNGVIPASPSIIKKLCHLDTEPDLNLFINNGFIDDVTLTSERRQDDVPETEKRQTREETDKTSLSEQVKPVADRVPYEEIVNLYHKILPKNPQVAMLNSKRKGQIAARWKSGVLPDLKTWEEYFTHIAESGFLMGHCDPPPGRKRFVADLEWVTNESNFTKIAEGKYHGKI